jgi:hypothetical protein
MEVKKKEQEHIMFVAESTGTTVDDMKFRQERREDMEREVDIIEKHREDIFSNKETQSVIAFQYNVHVCACRTVAAATAARVW